MDFRQIAEYGFCPENLSDFLKSFFLICLCFVNDSLSGGVQIDLRFLLFSLFLGGGKRGKSGDSATGGTGSCKQ